MGLFGLEIETAEVIAKIILGEVGAGELGDVVNDEGGLGLEVLFLGLGFCFLDGHGGEVYAGDMPTGLGDVTGVFADATTDIYGGAGGGGGEQVEQFGEVFERVPKIVG